MIIHKQLRVHLAAAALAVVLAVPSISAWAEPPAHAPAHGWRKKHDPNYVGYTGKKWAKDYGVSAGSCNMEAVGAVLGGVVGGAVGSQAGRGDGRVIATVLGTVIGAVIGAKVGRGMEEADRACIGHTLEIAGNNASVKWINPHTGVSYVVTPVRGYKAQGQACREFSTRASMAGKSATTQGRACRSGDGVWRLIES
jgi:surface antigen